MSIPNVRPHVKHGSAGSKGPSVAVAGIYHESNTFARNSTGVDAFVRGGIHRGGEVSRVWGDTASALGGFLRSGQLGLDLTPVFSAWASPSGIIEHDAFTDLTDELCDRLAGGSWDAVLLALHGAAVADGYDNADGYIAERVREAVGPSTVIGMCLDPHANISAASIAPADITLLYRTNPHVDAADRAGACAELVARCLAGEIVPVKAVSKPPLIVNILKQNTNNDPLRSLQQKVVDSERNSVLSASLSIGYQYADVPDMGPAIVVISDNDIALAEATAQRLSKAAWDVRVECQGDAVAPETAAMTTVDHRDGTVLLLDTGDNIGAGSPGDSTTLLHALHSFGAHPWLTTIVDPLAVDACADAGVGAEVDLLIGGQIADHDPPFPLRGKVKEITSGRFTDRGVTHGGFAAFDMGMTAAVETFSGDAVVITTHAVIDASADRYRSVGLDPTAFRVIVARGVQSPLPAYEPLVSLVVSVRTPGVTTADVSSLTYRNRRTPLYPLD